MENQQKINRIKDMIRQYEYEKFDADLRLGVYSAMGKTQDTEHLKKQSDEAKKALTYLEKELAKYPEITPEVATETLA